MEKNICGSILDGFGNVLKGIAAILAVIFAKEPAQDYFKYLKSSQEQMQLQFQNQLQRQNQKQEQNNSQKIDIKIDINKVQKEVSELVKSNNRAQITKNLDQIPSNFTSTSEKAVGLVIGKEFRSEIEKELLKASTEQDRIKIIENYWNRSLKNESKDVDLKLGVEK